MIQLIALPTPPFAVYFGEYSRYLGGKAKVKSALEMIDTKVSKVWEKNVNQMIDMTSTVAGGPEESTISITVDNVKPPSIEKEEQDRSRKHNG